MAKVILYATSDSEKVKGWFDTPLSDTGRQAAEALALKLEGRKVYYIYCSPLLRARETARVIARHLGVPMRLDRTLLPKASSEVEDTAAFRTRFLNGLKGVSAKVYDTGKTYVLVTHPANLALAGGSGDYLELDPEAG